MKNKSVKIVLATMMFVILVMSLTACGLFTRVKAITDADVSVSSGLDLTDTENQYTATLGADFKLQLSWTIGGTKTPKIVWYVAVGDTERTKIADETKKTLTYSFDEIFEGTYTFSATVDKIETSTQIAVGVKYATLKTVDMTSASSDIVQNVIQQNYDTMEEVDLSANWDAKYFAPGYNDTLKTQWYVNGAESSGATTKNFKYLPIAPADGEKLSSVVISVRVRFGAGATDYIERIVTVSVVRTYKPVDSISISVSEGAVWHDKGYYTQFASDNVSSLYSKVKLNTEVFPSTGTNFSTAAVWKHRTQSGIVDLDGTSREIFATLAPGKNVFSAVIDNVVSREITVYALSESGYNARKDVIDDTFIWGGSMQSGYIMDDTDLSAFVSKLISSHEINTTRVMYLQHDDWKAGDGGTTNAFIKEIGEALDRVDESGHYAISYTASSMRILDKSGDTVTSFGYPEGAYPTTISVEQMKVLTHFSSSTTLRSALPIDAVEDEMLVRDSNMLFRVLSWGYKPTFEKNENGNKLSALYGKAREILCDINDDKMSEYEKVRAIYEWILTNVAYDYKVAEANSTGNNEGDYPLINYNAFYLEGVFNDKLAVCDGKSKAFALMCGMEGITAIRLIGLAQTSSGMGGHAWNKVLVDANNDGIREWFVVDTTWGDAGLKKDDNNYLEIASKEYFLIDDSAVAETHFASQPQPQATTKYEYYKNTFVTINGEPVSLRVETEAQLQALINYSAANGSLYLEIENAISKWQTPEEFGILCSRYNATYLLSLSGGNGGIYIIKK